MNVANASFSQIPFHQRIVTRSPNHMWASSCAIGLGDVEALVVRGLRRIEQQQRLAVGHEPGVLHRALREVRDRRLVELLLGVRDGRSSRRTSPGSRRRPRSRSRPGAAGRGGRRPGSGSGPANDGSVRPRRPDDDRTRGRSTSRIDRANRTRTNPGSAGSRPISGVFVSAVSVLGDDQRHRERRLEVGLVPAREVAAGVGRLEVRRDDDVLAAGVVGVARAVHPLHQIAELAGELQAQRCTRRSRAPPAARA